MEEKKGDYYRPPALLMIPLVPFGMLLVTAAAFAPSIIPYACLGPVGSLTKYLVINAPSVLVGISLSAWILHVGEAWFASSLCTRKNLNDDVRKKWVVQTFIYGIFSLKYLLAYEAKKSN